LFHLVLPVSTTPGATAMKVYLGIVLLSFYASSATANDDIRGFIPKDENALLTSSGHQEHRLLDHVDPHTEMDASMAFIPEGEGPLFSRKIWPSMESSGSLVTALVNFGITILTPMKGMPSLQLRLWMTSPSHLNNRF
jgi:hypothetical protein